MNKYFKNITLIGAIAFAAIALVACTDEERSPEDEAVDTEKLQAQEQLVLDAWMQDVFPQATRMTEGYFLDITKNDAKGESTKATTSWVRYNITSSDLENTNIEGNSNINLTRDEQLAIYLQGSFNQYTHYIPQLMQLENSEFDALDLALSNNNFYEGSTFTLYAPSFLASNNVNGVGGFAGSSSLSYYKSFQSNIEIVEIIENIETEEDVETANFNEANGDIFEVYEGLNDEEVEQVFEGLYFNSTHNPTTSKLVFSNPYPYTEVKKTYPNLEQDIQDALIERFGKVEYPSDVTIDSESANIWYITRFLDGFIADTNIDEVREIIYSDFDDSASAAFSFSSDGGAIEAWTKVVPTLKYGTWNTIMTISTYAYGEEGVAGSSSQTEIQPYTPLIFEFYIEPIDEE